MSETFEYNGSFAHQTEFLIDKKTRKPRVVHYVPQEDDAITVTRGVSCFVYEINGQEQEQDLGIIQIVGGEDGAKTPRQKVKLENTITVEKPIEGEGVLYVKRNGSDKVEVYDFTNPNLYKALDSEVVVFKGDEMQWVVEKDKAFKFHELCIPPFSPDRFETVEGEDLSEIYERNLDKSE